MMKVLTTSLMSAFALALVFCVIFAGDSNAGITPDLIAYYDFEEGSGTTLTDLSGNGNNGTWVNTSGLSNYATDVPTTLSGSSVNAGYFHGTKLQTTNPQTAGDYVALPYLQLTDNALNGDGVTVAFWVKKENSNKQWVISETDSSGISIYNLGIDCENEGSERTSFMVRANDYTMLLHSDEMSSAQKVSEVTEPEWHHIAWTDNNGTMKIYVDGVLDSTDFTYSASSSLACNTTTLGAWLRNPTTADYHYSGLIDDFAAWDGVLADTQIAALAGGALPTTVTVPEPSTIILLLGALGTLLAIRRK